MLSSGKAPEASGLLGRRWVSMNGLDDKKVLVTGSSVGIGRAIAIRFAEEGAHVVVNYHKSREEAHETQQIIEERGGHKTLVIQADVSREADVRSMFESVLSEWGRLDILINNAGILRRHPSHDVPMEEFDRVLAVNLRGAFICSREAIRHFLARGGGGVIVNNSSVHETIPGPEYIAYAISKAGMENLTKTLALEYADRGIRVNTVGPGAIETRMNRDWLSHPEARETLEGRIPLGRIGTPEEMAGIFAFLASDDASYITGQTLYACGGLTIYPSFRTPQSPG
jgi:glucose 1-dehydrogenase